MLSTGVVPAGMARKRSTGLRRFRLTPAEGFDPFRARFSAEVKGAVPVYAR